MAKKQMGAEAEVEVVTQDEQISEPTKKEKGKEKVSAKAKNNKNTKKGPNKLVTKFKEIVSELKKVSWPSFKTVCKNTGIVISVVVIFTLVLFGIDRLLSFLYTFIPGA
jgi:preprotein translocase subunit SecE